MGPRRIWCGDGWNRAASPNPWSGPLDAGMATRRCLKTRSGHWRASATSGTSPRPPASSAPSGCAIAGSPSAKEIAVTLVRAKRAAL